MPPAATSKKPLMAVPSGDAWTVVLKASSASSKVLSFLAYRSGCSAGVPTLTQPRRSGFAVQGSSGSCVVGVGPVVVVVELVTVPLLLIVVLVTLVVL